MPRRISNKDVFSAAVERMTELYAAGHRIVVAFSGGKDSTVILNVSLIAARLTNRLPVEVFMRDDEAMFPGTFEYAERIYNHPDVAFTWASSRQPMNNVFNRYEPYWWVFDDRLDPSKWVRTPPPFIQWFTIMDLYNMISPKYFPPPTDKWLISVVGNRVSESRGRLLGIHSSGGYLQRHPDRFGVRVCRPIYDWNDTDVWRAINENHWDYNTAYDVMYQMGVPKKAMRIAPPTMTWWGAEILRVAARAWPQWFERLAVRAPGTRQVVYYGHLATYPLRNVGESWEQCFIRECIDTAPQWIADRSRITMKIALDRHRAHSATPFPDVQPCYVCAGHNVSSWKALAELMYTGDPYCLKASWLPTVQPSMFRPTDLREWESSPASGV